MTDNNILDEEKPRQVVFPVHERTICCVAPCEKPVTVNVLLDDAFATIGALRELEYILVPLCQFHYDKAFPEKKKK